MPLLLTKFSTENIARWRDVLAPALLPMPSETYSAAAVDVAERRPRRTRCSRPSTPTSASGPTTPTSTCPAGSYDDERIQFIRGTHAPRG